MRSWVCLVVLIGGHLAAAGPAANRVEPLRARVSVDDNREPSNAMLAVTMINFRPTTLNPAPTSTTAKTTYTSASVAATATTATPIQIATGGRAFEVCDNKDGAFAPFCTPINGSTLYLGETAYVTWDTSFFAPSSTVFIQANFLNMVDGTDREVQAFQSNETSNSVGFIAWTQMNEYLEGFKINKLNLFIKAEGEIITGPTVQIATSRPPPPFEKQPMPDKRALFISLPAFLGVAFLCLLVIYLYDRKRRKMRISNTIGRRSEYSAVKSKRQRMGLSKRKPETMKLRLREMDPENQYRDEPVEQFATQRLPPHHRNTSYEHDSLVGRRMMNGHGSEPV